MKKSLLLTSLLIGVVSLTTSCKNRGAASPTLEEISIASRPTKVDYEVGEAFSLSGLVVNATYSDESVVVVDEYSSSLEEGYVFTSADVPSKEIVITYEEKTASFTVNVSEIPEVVTLTKIEVTKMPNKMTYELNEEFDPTGMEVTATYSNGDKELITDYVISPVNTQKVGSALVLISYQGKNAQFYITVEKHEERRAISIEVKSLPTKVAYFLNQEFDPAGLVITVNYNDDTSEDINTGFNLSTPDMSRIGEQLINVSYGDLATSFKINISKAQLVSISITTKPTLLIYYVGQEFNLKGMVVTATYEDGSTQVVEGTIKSYPDMSTAGEKIIFVEYKEDNITKSDAFSITVLEAPVAELDHIEITSLPSKIEYKVGEEFDGTGMVVKAFYDDGSSQELSSSLYQVDVDLTTVGQKVVTISYLNKTDTFDIYVISEEEKYMYDFARLSNLGLIEIDENKHQIIVPRLDNDKKLTLYYNDATFNSTGAFVSLAPGGYITMAYEEGDINALPKIEFVQMGANNMNYNLYVGYASEGSDSAPFKVADAYSAVADHSFVPLGGLPSYIGISNPNNVTMDISSLYIAYMGGLHSEDPYKGMDSHDVFVSGVYREINGQEYTNFNDSNWNYSASSFSTASFLYRQGNMTFKNGELQDYNGTFDITVNVLIMPGSETYFSVNDAYIKNEEDINRNNITISEKREVTYHSIQEEKTTLSVITIEVKDATLDHRGGPFLYIEMGVDVGSASPIENVQFITLTSAIISKNAK